MPKPTDKDFWRYKASDAGKGGALRPVDKKKFDENYDRIFGGKDSLQLQEPVRNRLRCKRCGDVIESEHRHDFVRCSCGDCAVDGGRDYAKRSVREGASWEEMP